MTVTAAVEPTSLSLARGHFDRAASAERREGRFAGEPLRVVAGRQEQSGCGVRADAVALQHNGVGDPLVEGASLGGECDDPLCQQSPGMAAGVSLAVRRVAAAPAASSRRPANRVGDLLVLRSAIEGVDEQQRSCRDPVQQRRRRRAGPDRGKHRDTQLGFALLLKFYGPVRPVPARPGGAARRRGGVAGPAAGRGSVGPESWCRILARWP